MKLLGKQNWRFFIAVWTEENKPALYCEGKDAEEFRRNAE